MINVSARMDELLREESEKGKSILLHACCAPCSSYVLTYLCTTYKLTVLYFNPNITERNEYEKRASEEKRFIDALNEKGIPAYPITYMDGRYDAKEFLDAVKGFENCPEGGERCAICFRLRLGETARLAAEGKYDYFATTLTLSPLKNAELLNEIGAEEGAKYGANYLPSNFKKKDGNKKSIELSREYGLYRQDYCGCGFSKAERERQKAEIHNKT